MVEQRCSERAVRRGGSAERARHHAGVLTSRSLRLAVVLAALTLPACNVDTRIGPGIGIGTGRSGSSQQVLVGVWTRVVVITDNFGDTHSSRTTWDFRSDGSATRTVIAENLSLGISDVLTAQATWRVEGSTLVVTFRPPDSGMSRFAFAVFSDVLTLDGRDFVRIG